MPFVNPTSPSLADFLTFLATSVQIPTAALPVDSPWPGYSFNQAMALVVCAPAAAGVLYTMAVYNLATAILFEITPDQSGLTYFADARSGNPSTNFPNGGFGLNTATLGLVTSASDEGTSSTIATPDWARNLTIGQLALFQTPWGRLYLAYAQSYGSTIWGLT